MLKGKAKMEERGRAQDSHPALKLVLLFFLYVSPKVFPTSIWTLLPVILRRQGISLGTIGFMAIVCSPWALKFVHASLVDRYYSDRLGKRKSWIVPLFWLSWIILPLLAYSMTMTMSAGPQAATNYAVLSSTSHLIGFTIMPIIGHICNRGGYFTLFGGLALGAFLSIFIGDSMLRRRLIYPEVA